MLFLITQTQLCGSLLCIHKILSKLTALVCFDMVSLHFFYVNKNIILQALSQWLHSNDPSRVSFLHWYWFSPAWILICALNNKHFHNVCNDRLYIYYVFSFYISHCIHTRTHENSFRSGYIYMHFIIVFVSVYLQMTGKMTQVCLFEMPCHITSIDMASLPCESRHDLKDYSSIRNSCHYICIGMTSLQYANVYIYLESLVTIITLIWLLLTLDFSHANIELYIFRCHKLQNRFIKYLYGSMYIFTI